MRTKYEHLSLSCANCRLNANSCGYWYMVTNRGVAHTAFATKSGLFRWLKERGLTLTQPIPEKRGTFQTQKIEGAYYTNMTFDRLPWGRTTKQLSNGQYTKARITRHKDGAVVINYLNPNVKDRTVYDHQTARKEMK